MITSAIASSVSVLSLGASVAKAIDVIATRKRRERENLKPNTHGILSVFRFETDHHHQREALVLCTVRCTDVQYDVVE